MARTLVPLIADVRGCARCSGDHLHLAFTEMAQPVDMNGERMTHWTPCPATGDPILFRPDADWDDRAGRLARSDVET